MSRYTSLSGEKVKRLASFIIGFPLTIISLAFVASFIYSNSAQAAPLFTKFNALSAAVGFLFICLFFFFRSLTWREILFKEGFKISVSESTYLLASSELKRYIPIPGVMAIVSRIKSFSTLRIPKNAIVRMIFYESIIFVITSAIISIPGILYLSVRTEIDPRILYLISFILFVAIFASFVFLKQKIIVAAHSLPGFLNAFLFMFVAWVFFGVGNFLIISAFYNIDPSRILAISSLIVLSWLVGYLVIIAPLGLGVREAFLTYALAFSAPLALAAALSIIARIAFTIAEMVFLLASYIFYKLIRIKLNLETHALVLWTMILAYIFYFTYVSFEKYNNFFTGRFDLGNMDQTVWNSLHGRIFELTNPDGINTISRLAFHSDFILIALAPFYLLWEDPRMLLLIQTVVLALGAYFVYKISEHVLKNQNISLCFAASYLLNPYLQKQNLFDFHAVTLATTFLLAAFYFIVKKRYYFMLLALVFAVITKEQIFVAAALILVYVYVKTKEMKWLAFSVCSFGAFYLLVAKFIPDARGSAHFATEYFRDFGDSPSEIIKTLVGRPDKTAGALFTNSNFLYLGRLLMPAGFISLLSPLTLIFAAPDLLINLLSKNENLRSLTFHYAAAIIPFIYTSAIFGAKKLLSYNLKFINSKTLFFYLLFAALASAYLYGTLPGSARPSLEIYTKALANRSEVSDFLNRIPPDLSVAATNNLGSHLSHRQKIYTLPMGASDADVIVLLLNDNYAKPTLSAQKNLVQRLLRDKRYVKVYESGDFIAFEKRR